VARKKKYTRTDYTSKWGDLIREKLDGLEVGQTIWFTELDDHVYSGPIDRLIEHPKYGNWVSVYCRPGGYRTKHTQEVSTIKIKKKRGRPSKDTGDNQ